MLAQTLWYATRPLQFLEHCHRRYGDVFTVRSLLFGTEVVVVRPEAIREVFTGDPAVFRAGEANETVRPMVGDRSLLLLDGAEHVRRRKLVLPPFHGDRIAGYGRAMRDATERSMASWPIGAVFSLHPHMQHITLEVILRTVFGLEEGAHADELHRALVEVLDYGSHPASVVGMIRPLQRDLGPLTPWAAFLRSRRRVDQLIQRHIDRRRAALAADGAGGSSDVLGMLLAAVDDDGRPLDDAELRDELMTLLAAGHETTATALCWLFERVLLHGEVQARLDDELARVVGDGALDAERIGRLEYLDACIKEALRQRPIIPAIGRTLSRPARVAGYDLPAGVMVVPGIFMTHHLPDLYPDPDRFVPERFLGHKPDPYAWLPFGGGSRRCLGMAFALYEMKVVAATVLRGMRLRLARQRPARIALRGFTYAPARGVEVVVEPRGRATRPVAGRSAPAPATAKASASPSHER
jgi:cytochrome P450